MEQYPTQNSLESELDLSLVSSDHTLVDLDKRVTRIWEFTESPEYNHVEISGGKSGDSVHERVFMQNYRMFELLRELGFRATQEFKPSRKQRLEYDDLKNDTMLVDWSLFNFRTKEFVLGLEEPLDDSDESWIPEEVFSLEITLKEGSQFIFYSDETEVYRFGERYEHMNFISCVESETGDEAILAFFDEEDAMDALESEGVRTIYEKTPPSWVFEMYAFYYDHELGQFLHTIENTP